MAKKSSSKPTSSATPSDSIEPTEKRPTASDADERPAQAEANPVLRQNAPIHCPYCKTPCESKSDGMFTRYRCVNKDCDAPFTMKVAKPRLSDRLGKTNDELSAR